MKKTALIIKENGRINEAYINGAYYLGDMIEESEKNRDMVRDIERYGERMFDRDETNIFGRCVRTSLYEY